MPPSRPLPKRLGPTSMPAQTRVRLHLLASAHALRVVVALPVAIRVAPASSRAVWIPLAAHRIPLGGALRACAPGDEEGKEQRQSGHDPSDQPGLVTRGRFFRQRSNAGVRSRAEGGNRG